MCNSQEAILSQLYRVWRYSRYYTWPGFDPHTQESNFPKLPECHIKSKFWAWPWKDMRNYKKGAKEKRGQKGREKEGRWVENEGHAHTHSHSSAIVLLAFGLLYQFWVYNIFLNVHQDHLTELFKFAMSRDYRHFTNLAIWKEQIFYFICCFFEWGKIGEGQILQHMCEYELKVLWICCSLRHEGIRLGFLMTVWQRDALDLVI